MTPDPFIVSARLPANWEPGLKRRVIELLKKQAVMKALEEFGDNFQIELLDEGENSVGIWRRYQVRVLPKGLLDYLERSSATVSGLENQPPESVDSK